MVDNLTEKGDKCPLNWGSLLCIVCIQLGLQKLSVIWNSGVSTVQKLQVLKGMEVQSGLSELSVMSAVEGCPLGRVPLYCDKNVYEHSVT